MAAGDEYGLTEDLYQQLIGRYVSTIEVLSKRIFAKDQHIAKIETRNAELEATVLKLETAEVSKNAEEGDFLVMDEKPILVKKPKGKK